MNKRDFIKACAVVALLLSCCCLSCTRQTARPSIVFILSDDQGWADIGYHGSEIQTPWLDTLAAGGIRLEHHYVYPVCSPTRAALLTGRFASRFGILSPIAGKSKQLLPPEVPTLPGLLADCGYRTHITGKWHLSLNPEMGPTHYGFQTSYGYLHGQVDPYTHRYKFGDPTWHRNDQLIDEKGHATDLITDDAVRFIKESDGNPFFLYVAYSVPHYPLNEPKRWLEPYEGKIEERSRRLYAASVTHMDAGIGKIIAALDQLGIRENTIVVFSSDNGGQENWLNTGELYGGRYEPDPVLGDNRPLRGWKGDVYEGGIRVPALISWPGTLGPGELDQPVHIGDWLPTLTALAGCPAPSEAIDGQDIAAALRDPDHTIEPRAIYIKSPGASALRYGDWKLIEFTSGRLELFQLSQDHYETEDLSQREEEKLNQLLEILKQQQTLDGEAAFR